MRLRQRFIGGDSNDAVVGYGLGLSEREAMANAWVGTRSLGELLDAIFDGKPLRLPDDSWQFELIPPGGWERVFTTVDTRAIT